MSFKLVKKPHMKNSVVTIASALPNPFVDVVGSETTVVLLTFVIAIFLTWSAQTSLGQLVYKGKQRSAT
jgi:hypothetical protein